MSRINPLTNRKVKIGGKIYNSLISQGYVDDGVGLKKIKRAQNLEEKKQDDNLNIRLTGRRIVNGIEHYVYTGLCNGILTKWITRTEWDYKISVKFNREKGELDYCDSNKHEIFVYEEDEEDFGFDHIPWEQHPDNPAIYDA